MKDPSPLLDHELPEEIASMLRAADEDVHPNAAAQGERLLARFAETAPSTTLTLTQRFGALRAAFVFTGLAAAGLAAFGWHASRIESPSPAPAVAPIVAAPAVPSTDSVSEPASAVPSIDVSALPTSPREAKRAPAPAPAKAERSNPSLDEELARIDRARDQLASGKPSEALAEVKAYRREYAVQSFADEADSVEVRALAALGRTSEARVLAERFLSKRPGSPYAEPVRAAVGMTR
ncbi:hypothetical protein AKJ09_04535 [Labilithrix luteola]|uniref:Uncharacterized protein n=1 Tax=Labilithrix luteola TaxID=1391654 RepID=A0A0K1PWX0_9BACT|nr:hypothetical protein [Labilithrix luteola]AKU97871.1 hypothetical protein AKJ09_04535 [Labilithrix luteola]